MADNDKDLPDVPELERRLLCEQVGGVVMVVVIFLILATVAYVVYCAIFRTPPPM